MFNVLLLHLVKLDPIRPKNLTGWSVDPLRFLTLPNQGTTLDFRLDPPMTPKVSSVVLA